MSSSRSGGSGSGSRTRVGRYEIGRTLGEGTFAKVKFARNVETKENVAIKILDKEKVLKHKMIGQVFLSFLIFYSLKILCTLKFYLIKFKFQLMIFFLLVLMFGQREIENLELFVVGNKRRNKSQFD